MRPIGVLASSGSVRVSVAVCGGILLGAVLSTGEPDEPGESPRILLVERTDAGQGGAEPVRVIEVRPVPAELLRRWRQQPPTPAQWHALFPVRVADGPADRPPLAGSYCLITDGVRFEPLYPLAPGHAYVAEWRWPPERPPLRATFRIPAVEPGPPVRVLAIYPSAATLPENTLRFYVHFSGEMSRGDVYRYLRLLHEDGTEVPHPFLELDEELWSGDGTRLTLFFHPGRVKRELASREEQGPILEAGRRYTLVVRQDWPDKYGRPLQMEYRYAFVAGPAEESPIEPQQWKLVVPQAGSRQPLLVRLPRPLDYALLERFVWLENNVGQRVPATSCVGGGERLLTFNPQTPWLPGTYYLAVDSRLEDSCGNRVGRPFEVDVFGPVTRTPPLQIVRLPFVVR